MEGFVSSTWSNNRANVSDFVGIETLSDDEIDTFASALSVAVAREDAIDGLYGALTESLARVWSDLDGSADMDLAAAIVSTGSAAAATVGYLKLAGDAGNNPDPNRKYGSYFFCRDAYGWGPDNQLQILWSIILLFAGVFWLAFAIDMIGGGLA